MLGKDERLYFICCIEVCYIRLHGGVTVPGSNHSWGLSVWSLHVLLVYAWVLSGYSGFLPPSKKMHVRLIGDSKLSLRVSVSVHGCLSLCGPVMDGGPSRVYSASCPVTAEIGSSWMDGEIMNSRC